MARDWLIRGLLDVGDDALDFVRNRKRVAHPGIYERPDDIAREAASRAAPEDASLLQLFGVTRDDLYEMSRTRRAGAEPVVQFPEKARGSAAAEAVMTPQNRQRIVDTLAEAENYPELSMGMDAWYNLDPAYDRLKQISDDPARDFTRLNAFTGMASPGSDVPTEVKRGTAANWLDNQGRFGDFVAYGGMKKGAWAPEDMIGLPGHPYHPTAQAIPMQKFVDGGVVDMSSPKVPTYIQSSLPEELGGTWEVPVGDAHWSRAVGLADTRGGQDYGKSVSKPELGSLLGWWRGISDDLGLQSVPAQARAWGTFSHATGVDTPVGAPKLELIAKEITRRAREMGLPAEVVRDAVLQGQMRLSVPTAVGGGGLLSMMGAGDAQAAPSSPEDEMIQYLRIIEDLEAN